jgi:hypothetical protein
MSLQTVDDVCELLHSLELQALAPEFRKNGINGV